LSVLSKILDAHTLKQISKNWRIVSKKHIRMSVLFTFRIY